MNRFLVFLLSVSTLGCVTTDCAAKTPYGVIAEERVINLPKDQSKWYVSVVGDVNDANYQKVISWFNTNSKLMSLKDQVHFCPVTSNTAIYVKRYAGNVRSLPTIRVQKADGETVYEAYGNNIPMSADGLNSAIAERVLPWRRKIEDRCRPLPEPPPDPILPVDPKPQPIIDGGPPDMDSSPRRGLPAVVVVLLLVGASAAGGATGLVIEWVRLRSK